MLNHLGSSHGDTRMTRLAVAEGERYINLVKRSHELWRTGDSAINVINLFKNR